MKSLLKNLGLILMIIGAAILVGIFCAGSSAINDNAVFRWFSCSYHCWTGCLYHNEQAHSRLKYTRKRMNKVVSKILAQLFLCFNIIKATTFFQLRQSSKNEEKAQAIPKRNRPVNK